MMFFRNNNSSVSDMGSRNNAFFRQLIFLGLLIVAGCIIFNQLRFFLGSALGAIVIYIAMRGILFKLTDEYKWKRWVASVALVLFLTIVLLSVGYLFFEVIAAEIPDIDISQMIDEYKKLIIRINKWIGYPVIPETMLSGSNEKFRETMAKVLSTLLNTTYSFAFNMFMMLILLFFMFLHGHKMEKRVHFYLPFKGKSRELIKSEVKNAIYSNVIGIPLSILAQAVASGMIYWIVGVNNVILWALLTALCGLIPLIGSAIVLIPIGVYLLATGSIWEGIVVLVPGLLLVTNIDNIVRMILMKKMADVHPLIVIFGVILGIPLFGFWGIVFGPLMISIFILLIEIYHVEYHLIPKEEAQDEPDIAFLSGDSPEDKKMTVHQENEKFTK